MATGERNDRTGSGRKAPGHGPQRYSFLTIALLFLAAVLVLDGLVGERGYLANRRARIEYEREMRALAEVRQRNQALRDQIERLAQDPSAIEEVARRDLHLVKRGEKVIIVKDTAAPKK